MISVFTSASSMLEAFISNILNLMCKDKSSKHTKGCAFGWGGALRCYITMPYNYLLTYIRT